MEEHSHASGKDYNVLTTLELGTVQSGEISVNTSAGNKNINKMISRTNFQIGAMKYIMGLGIISFCVIGCYTIYLMTREESILSASAGILMPLDVNAPPVRAELRAQSRRTQEFKYPYKQQQLNNNNNKQSRKSKTTMKLKPKVVTKKQEHHHHHKHHNFRVKRSPKKNDHSQHSFNSSEPANFLQIIEQNDDFVPSGRSSFLEHASDLLECREHVINFVINATDARDECQGLKKAFDKTCNIDSSEGIIQKKQQHQQQKNQQEQDHQHQYQYQQQQDVNPSRQRRKLLFESSKSRVQKLKYRFHRTVRWVNNVWYYFLHHEPINFFAEEEVVAFWETARYEVEQDFDLSIRKEHVDMITRMVKSQDERRRRLEEQGKEQEQGQTLPMQEQEKEQYQHQQQQEKEQYQHQQQQEKEQYQQQQQEKEQYQQQQQQEKEQYQHQQQQEKEQQQKADEEKKDLSFLTDGHVRSSDAASEAERYEINADTFTNTDQHLDRILDKVEPGTTEQDEDINKDTNIADTQIERHDDSKEADSVPHSGQEHEIPSERDQTTGQETDLSLSPEISNKQDEGYPHKMQSLTLPTSAEHISGKMLSETLILQHSEDTIRKAMWAVSNQTNGTALSEAAEDAVVSAQMVQETANALSKVLNDPKSVEARTCCASIIDVFHQNCDTPDNNSVSDQNLFLIVFVFVLCGIVKSTIRHFQINWLPEAAGCILVGVACGAVMTSYIPHFDVSFDGDVFLRVMVPPIVLEAALSIDKRAFHRHFVPVLIYAFCGTLIATFITAFIIHKGTVMLRGLCETIPFVESLAYGALISSIDPIAVLSVLSNMGMSHTDSIYVIIFGEALLNDGIAIVLFETLVHFLDESLVIDMEAIISGTIHFFVVAFGSLFVGVASGVVGTCYFWLMQDCQTPVVEVMMFFCWAFTPYYICDGVGWSGIVAVVATGFAMDLFVVGEHNKSESEPSRDSENVSANKKGRRRSLFYRKGHLSSEARNHVGFVCELLSTMMETAIFAYLGVFLFSSRYHWNKWHIFLSIFACCVSRAIMIPSLTMWTNWLAKSKGSRRSRRQRPTSSSNGHGATNRKSRRAEVIVDCKMQMVLWFGGLRGAMSFALVENIPLYDAVTGEGSRLKAELKAMTSATIIFTVFVLGGMTFCVMERLGLMPSHQNQDRMAVPMSSSTAAAASWETTRDALEVTTEKDGENSSVRQRPRHDN